MTSFKPMLACKLEDVGLENLAFPLYGSPKIDGVRALVRGGRLLSRKLKEIPNKYTQALFGHRDFEGLDGELVVGQPNAPDCMQVTMSGVMSVEGEPDVTFHVFDSWLDHEVPFNLRGNNLLYSIRPAYRILEVPQVPLRNELEVLNYETHCLSLGYEGIMLRTTLGGYKHGRCGKKQPWLIKVKRFEDSEAVVIGVEELQHNENEAQLDELGHTKRSTAKAGKRGAGVLGALVCRTAEGVEFNIGTGFTQQQRADLWRVHTEGAGQPAIVGRIVTYKHFAAAGVKEAPRFPVFKSFRSPLDL